MAFGAAAIPGSDTLKGANANILRVVRRPREHLAQHGLEPGERLGGVVRVE
jgi:hypothetical protein